LDVIKKLHVGSARPVYSPPNIPDREKFEESFTTFMRKNGARQGVCIGHPNWLHHRHEFQLSIEFCKMVIDKMDHFNEIELYNVHDCHDELKEYFEAKEKAYRIKHPHCDYHYHYQPKIILHNEEPEAENMDQD